MEVIIEENKYPFEIDLGGDFYFSISKDILANLKNKKPSGLRKSFDIKGNAYDSPVNAIKLIEISKIKINNAPFVEEQLEFILDGSVLDPPLNEKGKTDRLQIRGRVGNRFFKGIDCWLIDFSNSTFVAIRNMDDEKKYPRFSSYKFTEATLEQTWPLIIISIETELGVKKFALDTGASRSILRTPAEFSDAAHKIYTTDYFKIGEHDFGSVPLYLFDMSPCFMCDGLLGRDFFRNHAVYLDFKKNVALISF
ncbi:MAG: retropepsin-like domain-containing protein [Parachlamydiales bacterium]|nr:retropepsin-like domain-containing protein [Parachlamydiales bacterium]